MTTVNLPALTQAQMQEVERRMVTSYHIDLLQIVENGGRSLALLAKRLLDGDIEDRPVVVLAGRGRRGSVGLAAARHLVNWGAWVQVLCAYPPDSYTGAAAQQLQALQAAGTSFAWAEEGWELPPCDLVMDAIGDEENSDGSSNERSDAKMVENLIALANSSLAPIVSVDVPTGIDGTTGEYSPRYIQADATLALGLPGQGTLVEPGHLAWGDLYVADVGVPQLLLEEMGIELPPVFAHDTLLPVRVVNGVAQVDV